MLHFPARGTASTGKLSQKRQVLELRQSSATLPGPPPPLSSPGQGTKEGLLGRPRVHVEPDPS